MFGPTQRGLCTMCYTCVPHFGTLDPTVREQQAGYIFGWFTSSAPAFMIDIITHAIK